MTLMRLALFTVALLCCNQVAVYSYPDFEDDFSEETSMQSPLFTPWVNPPQNDESHFLPDIMPTSSVRPGYMGMMYPMMNMDPNMNGTMPEMYMQPYQFPMYHPIPPRQKMTADMFDQEVRPAQHLDDPEFNYYDSD